MRSSRPKDWQRNEGKGIPRSSLFSPLPLFNALMAVGEVEQSTIHGLNSRPKFGGLHFPCSELIRIAGSDLLAFFYSLARKSQRSFRSDLRIGRLLLGMVLANVVGALLCALTYALLAVSVEAGVAVAVPSLL